MWADLALECAPNVAVSTMEAIIRVESGGNPLALNVNGVKVQPVLPKTKEEATRIAREWMAKGKAVDIGLMQISSSNLPALGLTVEQVLEPCANLRAGAAILSEGYARAVKLHGPGQRALQAALSAYNTGSLTKGAKYVAKYYGQVPALNVAPMETEANNPFIGRAAVHWPGVQHAGDW